MNVPKHIAIIMDGNRRWAENQGLSISGGHRAGAETVKRVVNYCKKYGIKNLTLYAFSTENWKRPAIEIKELMQLLYDFLTQYLDEMISNGIKLYAVGKIEQLPFVQRSLLMNSIEKTKENKNFNLVLAINYGGRAEIVDATAKIAKEIEDGQMKVSDINEENFRKFLYCPELPDPDLLIRTSGEMRISNFLLWQISYSEIHVTDVLWPDFSEEDFLKAIKDYSNRKRRFGGR